MAVNVFELVGKIGVDGVKKAQQDIKSVTGEAEKSSSKIGAVFSKIGKGVGTAAKVIGTGIGVAAGAIGGLTVKALSMSGDLEQNMGGSEAVFGKYANKMQDTAKHAFSNMGLSTSDYLATANKMGALFQGAGFDVEKSMTLSQDAMQRAADVASIMGIDTTSAMEAIAGAAKGNFTMMDNLGVAMNDTTLNAYALEKGIGKTTQEMTNQEKIGLAMEMFMEKTAYAAGNYAKENETLAGSLGTAKAAISNFLSGSGSVEDVVSSVSKAGEVVVKNIGELFPKLMTGLTQIVSQLVPKIPPLLQQLLPPLIQGAVSLVNGIVSAMPQIISAIMGAVPVLIEGIMQIMNAVIEALPQIIQMIVSALPTLIPLLIDGLVSMIVTLCNNFVDIIQPIILALPDIIMSIIEALLNNLPILIEGVIQLVLGIVNALPQILETLIGAIPQIISMLIDGFLNALPMLIKGSIELVGGIVKALPQILSSLIKAAVNAFKDIWKKIQDVFSPLGNWFGKKFKEGNDNATKAWSTIGKSFNKVWENVKSAFSKVGSWFKDQFTQGRENAQKAFSTIGNFFKNVWNGIKNVFSSVGSWFKNQFTQAKNNVQTAWSSTKNFFSNIWSGIKNTASNAVNGVKNAFSNAWNNIKSKTSSVWNGIKTSITKPIQQAKDKIKEYIDKIKGFFTNFTAKIKLPHFKISNASLNPKDWITNGLPKLSVEWYKKGAVLTKPTAFGINPNTNSVMVGGEAGAEAIAPISTMQGYIKAAVAEGNEGNSYYQQRIYEILAHFLPLILNALDFNIVLDDGTLVGKLASKMDKELGSIYSRKARY